ncbi:MAG: phosphate acyltransferase PlsX [Lachnospiraceae bacterium]|nr:phosphate acyltransferase PlsX [Lachnospiraceae bacterium]
METLKIALDAMGGDKAPACDVEGAVKALKEHDNLKMILLGDETAIKSELAKFSGYPEDRLEVVHCSEKIEMAEPPVAAISSKQDSSIVKGMRMVRKGEADAFISAGSTGAILVGGQVLVGRLKGVERPPLGALMPTEKGMTLLIDCGANVDARPSWLLQFAEMGSIYVENVLKIRRPRVAIVNIGAEEEKGNTLVKETFPLLKEDKAINFIGSIEARDIPAGGADVIVTDAFSGNLILKMYEGTANTIYRVAKKGLKSSVLGMIGGAIAMKPLKKSLRAFDSKKYGGAPLLGLRGLVVKAHGSSDGDAIAVAINQCLDFYRQDINGKIKERMEAEAEHMKELKRMELRKGSAE